MARRLSVTVRPNSRSVTVAKIGENEFRAAVREPAHDGKANLAVVDLLARDFGISKSRLKIIRGHSSKRKIIELLK